MPSLTEMDRTIKERLFAWVIQNAPKLQEIETAFSR